MSTQKSDIFSEIAVGGFMLAVLALLVYFTICISGVDVLSGNLRVPVVVEFDHVGGLKAHDSVFFRGTKVGGVDFVEVTPSNLVVHIEIDPSVTLRRGYSISVRSLSMLGGNYLALEEGDGEVLPLTTTRFRGEHPTDWMRDLAKIASNLRALTEANELRISITNIQEITASIRRITDRVERGEGSLGQLLSTNDTVFVDLRTTMANASEVSERMKNSTLIADLERGAQSFCKAADSLDLAETRKSADELLAKLNTIASRMEAGEGTIGKLICDREVYDDLKAAIKDVRQVLDNYRDTTPISTFGSLATGAL